MEPQLRRHHHRVQSGLCLDVNGAATGNGSKLILWTCNGGTNQQWSLRS